jgi:hypothetical protein
VIDKEITCDVCMQALTYPYTYGKKRIERAAMRGGWYVRHADGRKVHLCPGCAEADAVLPVIPPEETL